MTSMRRRPRRAPHLAADTGAAAVEFALVLLPLVLILFGIIDFGRAYNTQLSMTAAAREGAREMALHNNAAAARAAVRNAAPDLAALTDSQISITFTPTTATCAVPASGTATPATVTVRVTQPLTSLSGFFTGLFEGDSLRGVGVMRCNG